jgi:hypothetical protein
MTNATEATTTPRPTGQKQEQLPTGQQQPQWIKQQTILPPCHQQSSTKWLGKWNYGSFAKAMRCLRKIEWHGCALKIAGSNVVLYVSTFYLLYCIIFRTSFLERPRPIFWMESGDHITLQHLNRYMVYIRELEGRNSTSTFSKTQAKYELGRSFGLFWRVIWNRDKSVTCLTLKSPSMEWPTTEKKPL